jgi:hypothetical protein
VKRLAFLYTMFGFGAAAQYNDKMPSKLTGYTSYPTSPNVESCWSIGGNRCNPANNECPACGTMAEPYKRPVHLKGEMMPTVCGPDGNCYLSIRYYDKDTPYGDTYSITRCKKCNNCFYRDEQ